MTLESRMQESSGYLTQFLGTSIPETLVVLGSGLGDFVDRIEIEKQIDYSEIPGFPVPSVEGHMGRLIMGRMSGVPMLCMQGRVHCYEVADVRPLVLPYRVLQQLGCKNLLLTSAVGSLNASIGPGSLVLINDHINLSGINPLVANFDADRGVHFVDLTQAYHPELRQRLQQAAQSLNLPLPEGVFMMVRGPNFETPAEVRAFKMLGADVVGMSTVAETLIANDCGLKVAAVSMVTNLAAGLRDAPLSHEETLLEGRQAAGELAKLLERYFSQNGG